MTLPASVSPLAIADDSGAGSRHAVIMAGGTGTRLWPYSRKASPKQFQCLVGDSSPLQEMYQLLRDFFPPERLWVQTGESCGTQVREQLAELPEANLILEPEARDTAAAFGLAAARIARRDPKAVLGIFYSDHSIRDAGTFPQAVRTAFEAVDESPGCIVLLGVIPTFPHTGMGYIQIEAGGNHPTADHATDVLRFIEKPGAATAEKLVQSGAYFWNTGYKVFNAGEFLGRLEEIEPGMAGALDEISTLMDGDETEEIRRRFATLPRASVEFLVTEKARDLRMVPCEMEWSDVGDWKSVYDLRRQLSGEEFISQGSHIDVGSGNCLVLGGTRLIATVGLKNILVVDTGDALLVADISSAQEVKQIVHVLEEQGLLEYL